MAIIFLIEVFIFADDAVNTVMVFMEFVLLTHVGQKPDEKQAHSHADSKAHYINERKQPVSKNDPARDLNVIRECNSGHC
jgi:hypothetical protein